MMERYSGEIKKLSKDSFITLLSHILSSLTVRKVVASEKYAISGRASITDQPRLDMVLSGVKHMFYPENGAWREAWLEPGTMHYCPPFTPKLPYWDMPHEMSSIVFFRNFLRMTYISLPEPIGGAVEIEAEYYYHTHAVPDDSIAGLCRLLSQMAGTPRWEHAAAPMIEALLQLVLLELRQDSAEHYSKKELTWQRLNHYLEENFHAPINRAGTAAALRLSPGYVSELFASHSGESFTVALRRMRLEYAARLLTETDDLIDQITDRCGYQSTTFFIAAFKRRYGVTPGSYRNLAKEVRRKTPAD